MAIVTTGGKTDKQAARKAAVLEEIRQELAAMTEAQRVQVLLELREAFGREQRGRLFNA